MKRFISIYSVFFVLIIILMCTIDAFAFTKINLYYAGELSNLEASSLDLWSAHIKDDKVTNIGSNLGLDIQRDSGFLKSFSVDLHATSSMVPTSFGSNEEETSLDTISFLFGIRKFPDIYIATSVLAGTGVVEEYSDGSGTPYYNPSGARLRDGDEFHLKTTYDKYYLMWKTENMSKIDIQKDYEGPGFYYGLGLVKIEHIGVRYLDTDYHGDYDRALTDQRETSYGIGVMLGFRYGTRPICGSTIGYFQSNGDVSATSNGGGLKTGYEAGLISRLSRHMILRLYGGGYFWLNTNWESDFGALGTDIGYSLGLELNYAFSD